MKDKGKEMAPTIEGAATALAPPPTRPADRDTARIRHGAIVAAVAEMAGVPPTGRDALGARIKSLLGMGMRRHAGASPGSGRGQVNGLRDALDVALAMTLQRAFAPPAAVASFMLANRTALDRAWGVAARGGRPTITVAFDALAHTPGTAGGQTGGVAAISFAEPASTGRNRDKVAAPRLTVDLHALYDATLDGLRRAGIARADLRAAENVIAEGDETP